MKTKPFWQSKTHWFNAFIALITGLVNFLPQAAELVGSLGAMGADPALMAKLNGFIVVAGIIGNMILRAVTSSAVTLR